MQFGSAAFCQFAFDQFPTSLAVLVAQAISLVTAYSAGSSLSGYGAAAIITGYGSKGTVPTGQGAESSISGYSGTTELT